MKALARLAALAFAFMLAMGGLWTAASWAQEGPWGASPGGGGGGGGVASTLVCLLAGGTDCTMTGPVLLPAGTVTAPALAFAADADGTGTGIYRDAANSMSFSANGLIKATVDASGFAARNAGATAMQGGTTGNQYFAVDPNSGSRPHTHIATGDFGSRGSSDNQLIWTPRALTITSPTDTTSVPVHAFQTITTSGAAAWTPSETGARDGSRFMVLNTSANTITLTASAGVFKGTCAIAQAGTAGFVYSSTASTWSLTFCNP